MQGAAKLDWNIYRATPWMNLQNSNLRTGEASYSMCTGVIFRGLGREVDHSPLSSAEVRKEWSCTSVFVYGVHRDNFAFTYRVMLCTFSATGNRGAWSEVHDGALAQPLILTFNNLLNQTIKILGEKN
jgi:hypothetical protein